MTRFAVLRVLSATVAVALLQLSQAIKAETKSKANILSFDGGGSKGILEVAILDDVMRLVTILIRDPMSLEYLTEDAKSLENENKRKTLVDDLAKITDPIHPTEVFDMIVGTSTGGLIAFGLVGGNVDPNGNRAPMSLQECINMYLNKTGKIFEKSWRHWFVSAVSNILTTYSQDNLKQVLSEQFGDSNLRDFSDSKSVAAVVAKEIGQKEELVLFDTRNNVQAFYETRQVLLATTDAPVYFETPVKIGNHEYVDGGVGGNCPLAQTIPRAQEIFGDVNEVLSVAPPSPKKMEIPTYLQFRYWLAYFAHQSTDGYAVYKNVKRAHKHVSFQRLTPRGARLKDFQLDENDAQKMLDAMNEERLANHLFLIDIIATATFVLNAYISKVGDSTEASAKVGAALARLAGKMYAAEHEHAKAEVSFKTCLHLWSVITEKSVQNYIAETEGDFSELLIQKGKVREASEHAYLSLKYWQAFYDDKDNQDISYALFLYGKTLHLSRKLEEGLKYYQLALDMQTRIYGEHSSNVCTAKILAHMGWFFRENGEFEKAESYLRNAFSIQEQIHGGDHIDKARALDSLGLCFTSQGKFKNGEEYLQQSLKMKERLFPNKKHPAMAASFNNLGWCFLKQQKYKLAQDYLEKALRMKQVLYTQHDHKSIAVTLENLAKSLLHQGEYSAALEYAQQSLDMKTSSDAVDGRGVAKTLHTIGQCLLKKENFFEAHKQIAKAIKIMENLYQSRPRHPVLATFLTSLGDSLAGLGNYSDAKLRYNEALDISAAQSVNDNHSEIPDLWRKLAYMSKKLGQREDEMRYKKRLEVRKDMDKTKAFSYAREIQQKDDDLEFELNHTEPNHPEL